MEDIHTKNYAVVKFLSDCTFSEIPTAWVFKEGDMAQCWWPPRNANSATSIANCTSPDFNTWSRHKVELIKYCSSLESARKSASDANYHTTDEERLGRGKRPRILNSRYCSSDEEESEDIQPRKLKTKKGGKTFAEKDFSTFTLPLCPDNFEFNTTMCNVSQNYINPRCIEISSQRDKDCANLHSIETSSQQDKGYCANPRSNETSSQRDRSCANPRIETLSQRGIDSGLSFQEKIERTNLQFEDVPIVLEEYFESTENKENFLKLVENMQEMLHVQGNNIQKMLRMQASANITMKDINQRLHKLEDERTEHAPNSVNDALIERFLPLSAIETVQEFDLFLKNVEEAVTQFKQYLLKIGGNSPKDNVHRVFKKVFTNECAMKCSMKGIRNNFKVGNLYIMKILRRELTSRHENLTETEFDNIVAEWFRFAKQRKTRDEKKAKENEDNINEEHRNNNNNNNNNRENNEQQRLV